MTSSKYFFISNNNNIFKTYNRTKVAMKYTIIETQITVNAAKPNFKNKKDMGTTKIVVIPTNI